MSLRNAIIICCLLLTAGAQAQDLSSSRRISSAYGLSNDFVVCMATDNKGYVWVGTEAGVNRIAGNTCRPMPTVPSVAGRRITSLYWDQRTGCMLIGTETGLTLYNPDNGELRLLDEKNGLVRESINCIAETEDGVLLVYGNGQIQRLEGKNYTPTDLKLKQSYPNRCALDDGKGNLYIGHSRHGMTVVRLADLHTTNYRQQTDDPHSLPGNNVRCIFQDRSGRIWVGTDSGLALFNPGTGSFTKVRHREDSYEDNVYDIRQMDDECLWVATDIGGVRIVNPETATTTGTGSADYLYYESSRVRISSLNPRAIVEDEFGNIWVGNHSTGVDFISDRKSDFSLLAYFDSDKNYLPVSAVARDTERGFWMASHDELVHWVDGKVAERWPDLGWMGREYIFPRSLMVDRGGNVWIGVDDQGVYRMDRKTGVISHITITPEGSDIHAFAEDERGRVWIGGEFGVYVYENGKAVRHDSLSRSIKAPAAATTILQTAPDELLLATLGDGICSYNLRTGKTRHLRTQDGLPSDKINQTIRSLDGGLWMATNRGLVYIADAVKLTGLNVYGKESGLSDDHVLALQQDAAGNVWVSTYKGISCFVKRTKTFYNFNHQDTHQHGAFSPGAALTGDDGTIYFGSVSGVCCFNPRKMDAGKMVSDVQIISCIAYNPADNNNMEMVQLTPDGKGRVYTTYRTNTLQFLFTVRNFAQVGQVDYSYKMKGMDDKWYDLATDDDIVFRGLQPGHYTFILRAKLRNQDWTEAKDTRMEIYIAPPFWRTWWAYLLYLVAIAAIATYLLRSYKRKLMLRNTLELERRESQQKQELNEERLRFFTNITHELRTPLTLILGPLDDLMDDKQLPSQSRRRVAMIMKSAERLRELINEILEFRKTETQNRRLTVARGDIGQFVREICLNYKELYRNPKVQFSYSIEDNLPPIWFDSEVITTIMNNFLSNAIKYTEQGSIKTTVKRAHDGRISITVTDTGYGISQEALPQIFNSYYQANSKFQASGTGIGLALVKALAELHDAQISVDSHEGQGSCFAILLSDTNTYPNALHKEDAEEDKPVYDEEPADSPDTETDEEQRQVLLVVEDNPDIRQYIAESFSEDFRIVQATNGEEGIVMAKEQIPDIIVSDIMMPRLNGIQLTRQLKDDIRTSHIPIILLTAKNTDEDKEKGYDSGADSYLTKPFTAKLLASRIQNLLTARRRMAEYITRSPQASEEAVQPAAAVPQLGRLDQEFLDKLNGIVQENILTQDIDLPFLTDKMAMSHSTFYRKVKALTGVSANEYIRKLRLRHCYQMLASGEYNVNQAAMMTGFNQMAHFREIFKKEYGILPSEVVKQANS